MIKSSLPTGVRSLCKWYEAGNLLLDEAVQRNINQWGIYEKSLLIHSMLAQMPVPQIFLHKFKSDEETYYSCLDGKQRLSNVISFVSNEWALHSGIEDVEIDGDLYEVAGKTFDELDDSVKDAILGYRFSISVIEDCTEEEIEDVFYRLNNGVSLSVIQKCRPAMGTELATWTREITNMDFFTKAVNLTASQLRREADLEVLLQTMLLLDARSEGYDYKAISNAEVMKYCKSIRDSYDAEKRKVIEGIFSYLSDAYVEKEKYLKKSFIPMLAVLAAVAIEEGISVEQFRSFVDYFQSYENEDYSAHCGSGNVKRVNVQGRLNALASDFCEYFKIDEVDINGVSTLDEAESEVDSDED